MIIIIKALEGAEELTEEQKIIRDTSLIYLDESKKMEILTEKRKDLKEKKRSNETY